MPQEWKNFTLSDGTAFTYQKILGQGGCGVVASYMNQHTGQLCAVKIETLAKKAMFVSVLN